MSRGTLDGGGPLWNRHLNRKVAKLFLEHQKWTVEEAQDGIEALQRLGEERFDMALLDVHMPKMDGPETLKRIRESDKEWRYVPVIALTANAMSGDREHFIKMGMDGYISKPIDQRELFGEINRVWAQAPAKAVAKAM